MALLVRGAIEAVNAYAGYGVGCVVDFCGVHRAEDAVLRAEDRRQLDSRGGGQSVDGSVALAVEAGLVGHHTDGEDVVRRGCAIGGGSFVIGSILLELSKIVLLQNVDARQHVSVARAHSVPRRRQLTVAGNGEKLFAAG